MSNANSLSLLSEGVMGLWESGWGYGRGNGVMGVMGL